MLERIESMSSRARTTALFASVAAFAFALIAWRAELRFIPLARDDGFFYSRMAHGDPDRLVLAPFRNRIFTPMLVSALPLPVPWGFALVTAVAAGATVAVMDRLLRLWFSMRVVWFGLALVVVSPLFLNAVDPVRVDTPLLAFSAAILYALATNRWTWLFALVPLATVNHELVLVLLIPIALTAWRQQRIRDAALVGGLSIVAWWVMHRSGWLVAENDRKNLFDAAYREEMVQWNAKKYGTVMGALWSHGVASIGILGLLAPFGWRRAPQLVKDATWVLIPCTIGIFTASDWGRLFTPALPVLVALSCVAATRLSGDGPVVDDEVAEDAR